MSLKIIFTECLGHFLTAISENNIIKELRYTPLQKNNRCQVGDIYIGKIKKILPKINAAFIEVADHTECYYSLEEKEAPVFTKKLSSKPFVVGDELLVQVKKEASKNKQPTVTGNLNFSGKYVVLTTGNKKAGVSSKIDQTRREELLSLASELNLEDYGIVFRTNAADAAEDVIKVEIDQLSGLLGSLLKYAPSRTCFSRLYSAPDPALLVLRDAPHDELEEIIVDTAAENGALYTRVYEYLQSHQPEDLPLLRKYDDPSYPLAKCYSLEHITEEALKEKVWMKSGGFLVIQPTEALTVIDVNTGKCLMKNSNTLAINMEAASVIAQQIRLRNLTGIIIVDFINMTDKEQCSELMHYLQHELSKDPNPGKVVDMTKLQLVEITRRKSRKTLAESLKS